MNKQALAFLTMFSLILMLSVYYVTLPADDVVVMKEDTTTKTKDKDANKKEVKKDTEVVKGKDTVKKEEHTSKGNSALALQEDIKQKKEEEMHKQSAVVSDVKSDETKKKDALGAIDTLKEEQSIQQMLVDALAKDKIKAAAEIKDNVCIVSVFEQKDDKKLAKSIMQKVSELTKQKYLIEVAFK